jgi:hypothetical protein
MAAKKKTTAIQRAPRRPSPMVAKLKTQLQKAQARATVMRAKVKEQNSAGATLASGGAVVGGGLLAGAAQGFLGDTWGKVAAGGLGLLELGLGAFLIPGTAGGLVAANGAGMLAKVGGDFVEDAVAGMGE